MSSPSASTPTSPIRTSHSLSAASSPKPATSPRSTIKAEAFFQTLKEEVAFENIPTDDFTSNPVSTPSNAIKAIPPLSIPTHVSPIEKKVDIYPTSKWISFAATITGVVLPLTVVGWGITSLFISVFFPPLYLAIIGVVVLIFVSRLACAYYQRSYVIKQLNMDELLIFLRSPLTTLGSSAQLTQLDFFKNFNEFFFYGNYNLVNVNTVKNKEN